MNVVKALFFVIAAAAPAMGAPARISKLFPSSTHSKTLEFCVGDIDDFLRLCDEFKTDFTTRGKSLSGFCYKITNPISDNK